MPQFISVEVKLRLFGAKVGVVLKKIKKSLKNAVNSFDILFYL